MCQTKEEESTGQCTHSLAVVVNFELELFDSRAHFGRVYGAVWRSLRFFKSLYFFFFILVGCTGSTFTVHGASGVMVPLREINVTSS